MIFDVRPGFEEWVISVLKKDRNVKRIYVIAGEHDLISIVDFPDYDSLYNWLLETRRVQGVEHIKSYIVIDMSSKGK
ncbi:MAG: Lrp/AsnC ligand binding domain-containing protein [Candidatus Freyarchaeota archaeon]|nr:Lrp/AsnC ligand binding domain-containing protein [Candidatus Freyrarchaeum guaymaensis]